MNRSLASLGVVFLLVLSGCATTTATVPTPSGKPELKVRLSEKEIESRMAQVWAAEGWDLQLTDEFGFALSKPYGGIETAGGISGAQRIRFNLMRDKADEGVTQIRATCKFVLAGETTDESGALLGLAVQESMEEAFEAEAVDGPYVRK